MQKDIRAYVSILLNTLIYLQFYLQSTRTWIDENTRLFEMKISLKPYITRILTNSHANELDSLKLYGVVCSKVYFGFVD